LAVAISVLNRSGTRLTLLIDAETWHVSESSH
jgi:hypothetical protein